MKRWILPLAATVILLMAVGVFLRKSPEIPPAPKPVATTSTDDGMKLVTTVDPALVFQKAFWRRPANEDKILHAERREWLSQDGVKKWQWYIAVSPGPQLLEWLKTNPFSLATTRSPGAFEKPPEWFPKSSHDFQVQQNVEARFTVMLSADGKQLYATDSGLGFSAPEATP
jgi:hypothetical protein